MQMDFTGEVVELERVAVGCADLARNRLGWVPGNLVRDFRVNA